MLRKRQYILALGDLSACILALTLMLLIRFGVTYNSVVVNSHIAAFTVIFTLWFVLFFIFNLYDIKMANPNPRTVGRLGLAIGIAVILGGFVFYAYPNFGIAPRANLVIVGIFTFAGIILWRRLFYRIFSSLLTRSIIVIGSSDELKTLVQEINKNSLIGKISASYATIEEALEQKKGADLIIAEPEDPGSIALLNQHYNADITTLVGAYEELFSKIPLGLIDNDLARSIATKHPSYGYTFFIRCIEITVSLSVLIITSPLILIAAIAKKLEDGGQVILSPHDRIGKNGKVFHCYKIRSMVSDAEKDGVQWTQKNDTRITPIGRILRKTHIDELPQFFNILKGDMALIGPRPERPEFVEKLESEVPYYYLRKQVAPGFTGWAQVKFRYARTVLDAQEKLEYDLYYAKNRTILLDVGILLKTIQIIFTH